MPVAGRNVLAFIILLGIFMFVIDGSVVSIALPTITRYFQADVAQSQWVITSYLVTVTSLLMIFGKIAERTGKVRLFLAGFVIFTMASVACGLSTTLSMLIFFRAVQAAGAAMSFSISTAIIFQIYHHGEQGRAMGYIGTTVSLASIAGPILGGYLVDYMGWKYIFLINLPIGIVLLALAAKYMKIEETRSKKLDLDWRGGIVLIIFIVSLMLFLGDLSSNTALFIAEDPFFLLATVIAAGIYLDRIASKVPSFGPFHLPGKKVRPAHNRHNLIHYFQLLRIHPGSLLLPGRHGLLALSSGQRISHCAGHNGHWLTTGRLDI